MEKETLEEFIKEQLEGYDEIDFSTYETYIELGAKWQQEQDKNKYSEEDLMEAYMEGGDDESIYKTFYQWFENFKNK
jgi:hypothetical protein